MFTGTVHVLGVPHTVPSPEYSACAFTQKVVKFCKMMMPLGLRIVHYGHERSQVQCTEHVTVTDDTVLRRAYGDYDWRKNGFKHDREDHAHVIYNANAKVELAQRAKPGDLVLCFWGWGNHAAVQGLPPTVHVIEPGIGYRDTFAPFRVFESYAVMHNIYGRTKCMTPPWFDTVIPNYFDLSEFDYSAEKDDYFLCMSRKNADKGITIAAQVCAKIGARLIVAGQGDLHNLFGKIIPAHVTELGYAEPQQRRALLAKAKGFFLPTTYIEPFGGSTVEAMLSGTPIITTDWGVFNETNVQGVTGFRCRTFEQFVYAAQHIGDINPADCRKWAEQYSLERIAPRYMDYFHTVSSLDVAEGWYKMRDRESPLWVPR